jgi:D-3-phosphoglycerate dehydrogenase
MSKVIVMKDWVCQMLAEGLEQSDLDWSWVDAFDGNNLMDAEVILTSPYTPVTREMMAKAKKLKGIVSAVIGVESIDEKAATELGIVIGHGATLENFIGMAEATILLMLALTLDMHAKEKLLRENLPRPKALNSKLLYGQTVGLIGFGRIGKAVYERLLPFGVNMLLFDPYAREKAEKARMVDLPTLLQASDIVSLHVTLTAETRHMIGESELRQMKPSAFLINTARGAVIDEQALHKALKEKWIAGAALDAFEIEPLPKNSPLRTLDNVILTPHILGHTQNVMASLPKAAIENIHRILAGQPPLYVKNPEVLPRWQERIKGLSLY